ncbi:hypothetical protein ACF0H5_012612 [Mactra antiquata]
MKRQIGRIIAVIFQRGKRRSRLTKLIGIIIVLQVLQFFWTVLHVNKNDLKIPTLKKNVAGYINVGKVFDRNVTLEQPYRIKFDLKDKRVLRDLKYGTCAEVPSLNTTNLSFLPHTSSLSDWTFTRTQKCPEFSTKKIRQHQKTFTLSNCVNATNSSSIYSVNFGDPCLLAYIESCCRDNLPVPNIVHYVWFGTKKLGYFNFLSLMSSIRFQRPCLILIHGPTLPHGEYWDFIYKFYPNILHVYRESPTVVFNNTLRFKEHASDVMRIEALINYGGIYLDFDEVILRPLDTLRQYNHTQGHELSFTMGSQLVMSRKNATFLQLWYQSYRDNYRKIWAYNALWVPNGLAKKYPKLIHVEGYNFTRPSWKNAKDIFDNNYDWSTNYGMHMYARWYKRPIDVKIIRTLNTTVGSVSRHILFGNKELCLS